MSLYHSDTDKKTKLFEKVIKFGPLLSILGYFSGIVYFCLLPHEALIHGTYISENALLPGLVSSDIFSTDSIFNYYHFLKDAYETNGGKSFNSELINDIFANQLKIESYTQDFNLTHPFWSSENENIRSGKNVYAFGRAQRADGTESIVISAPIYLTGKKNKKIPNLFGISQLFILANLAKNRPYWAKDLIFVATDMEHVGIQAWINSYFETHSDSIMAESLKTRGGSIQAALNLEFSDINTNKLEIKLEGPNGKLPNLDLFNTIIRICKSMQFECSLESEKSFNNDFSYYHNRPPVDHVSGLFNTVNMMFKQATGVPNSLNGYFLNHRIEALTISGTKTSSNSGRQQKQNVLKITRIVESTLRSVNNLLERFHQSFFFYLLPSSHYYISIGMYMPAFGLILLPVLIKILTIWFTIFSKKNTESKGKESSLLVLDLLKCVVVKLMVSFTFGIILYFGTPFFLMFGKVFNLSAKDSLMNCYLAMMANIFVTPFIFKTRLSSNGNKTEAENINKLIILLSLTIFVGTISVLNFSLAFFIAIFYSPVSILAIQRVNNKILKTFKIALMVLACPLVYFSLIYIKYHDKFYDFVLASKISDIWTYEMVNLFLVPIWSTLWITAFN
ncbi:glycosylphosphatidylinositol anchor attachment 1 isoform X1 [Brachionus plicatilis]|uniref:Glycosylphosphatidylinositol anchor attachment 1 isoform X1 n=1 Tax=Brachionus plicatilis TaxID=10195 RepID=A0A3M7PNS3_BRAPC|nr:glycosylphosphatidylinositol anchor attachment 1 isoform X1 [Brachionus plicatilis]